MDKVLPKIIFSNNCGIQINVNPVAAGPEVFIISKISDLGIFSSLPSIEKTVLKIITADRSETILLPIAVVNAFLTIPYLFFI